MKDKLQEFLKSGGDWERKQTTIPGVFVLRMPQSRFSPASLAIEINPVDSGGHPTKKRGLIVRSAEELDRFAKIIQDEKVKELLKNIDEVNPESRRKAAGQDVLEV